MDNFLGLPTDINDMAKERSIDVAKEDSIWRAWGSWQGDWIPWNMDLQEQHDVAPPSTGGGSSSSSAPAAAPAAAAASAQEAPLQEAPSAGGTLSVAPAEPKRKPTPPWRHAEIAPQPAAAPSEPAVSKSVPPPPPPSLGSSDTTAPASSRSERWRPRGGQHRNWYAVFHALKKQGETDTAAAAAANAAYPHVQKCLHCCDDHYMHAISNLETAGCRNVLF